MEKNHEIFSEEKWNAIINCDRNYDNLFYYAVKTTGIFCRPSCKAKAPLKKNVLFFNSIEDAIESGFRPCKMCRPDINEHIYEPNREVVEKAKKILTNNYNKEYNLKYISYNLGVSDSHLRRLFKEYYGLTPREYIIQVRIEKAINIMIETDLDISEIAYDVGFKTLSNFYKYFKDKTGCAPNEYRKRKNLIK